MITARIVMCALLMVALGGCVAALSDSVSLDELSKENKGAVVFHVDFTGTDCSSILAHVSRQTEAGYKFIDSFPMKAMVSAPLRAWPFEAGTYHITGAQCIHGMSSITHVGITAPSYPTVSYSTFQVEPGEVTDIGMLMIGGALGHTILEVKDIRPDALESLRANTPQLAAGMKKRPMVIDAKRTNTEETESALRLAATPPIPRYQMIYLPSVRIR